MPLTRLVTVPVSFTTTVPVAAARPAAGGTVTVIALGRPRVLVTFARTDGFTFGSGAQVAVYARAPLVPLATVTVVEARLSPVPTQPANRWPDASGCTSVNAADSTVYDAGLPDAVPPARS